jgi:hypothetical protein
METTLGAVLLFIPALYALTWAWLRQGGQQESELSVCAENILIVSTKVEVCTDNGLSNDLDGTQLAKNRISSAGKHATTTTFDNDAVLSQAAYAAAGPIDAQPVPLFSVLVAARNEAATLPHLLQALQAQTLPPHQFEVLIADDHSTDGTTALVITAAQNSLFGLRLVTLPPGHTGKKAALAAAEAQARAPWVVCTDADCRPGPGWLSAYADLIHPSVHFISGPVRLTPGGAWFDELLGLEFAGLVGVGAACIARGRPTMCNGANLAFRRATFHEVGGYADNVGLASGDDEFLLHKMHQRYPAGIRFLADARAVVDTPAPATLRTLLRQRVRWASKWPHYRTSAGGQRQPVRGAGFNGILARARAVGGGRLGPQIGRRCLAARSHAAAAPASSLVSLAAALAATLRALRAGRGPGWAAPHRLPLEGPPGALRHAVAIP